MRISALNGLRQYGKVMTFDPRSERKTVILLASQTAAGPANVPWPGDNWRPNMHRVIVGGAKLEGILDIGQQIGERTGFSLSLPSFELDSRALLAKRRIFEASGIGTFYAWEKDECSRINIFDLRRGELLYTPEESLENPQTNWNRHGLVFVHREEEPRTLSLKLSLRRG
jgi:hypothetical protein